jgi:hypothetical protein
MAQFSIEWQAPEFEYREKDISWYWISIILACIIVAFAAWERNFLFGFFVVIAEMLFVSWGDRSPRLAHFDLTEKEFVIDAKKFYTMGQLEAWCCDRLDEEWTELIFSFKAKLKTPVKVLVPTGMIEEIRKNLKTILRETEYQPTLLDALEKLIRF